MKWRNTRNERFQGVGSVPDVSWSWSVLSADKNSGWVAVLLPSGQSHVVPAWRNEQDKNCE